VFFLCKLLDDFLSQIGPAEKWRIIENADFPYPSDKMCRMTPRFNASQNVVRARNMATWLIEKSCSDIAYLAVPLGNFSKTVIQT
jgi:hypothetical protein